MADEKEEGPHAARLDELLDQAHAGKWGIDESERVRLAVARVAMRIYSSMSGADLDALTSEVLFRVMRSYDPETIESPRAWSRRVILNAGYKLWRRNDRANRGGSVLSLSAPDDDGQIDVVDAAALEPSELMIREERVERLYEVVSRLTEQEQRLFEMRARGDPSLVIAAELGITDAATRKRLERLRTKLARLLAA